jgi:hypothetical protein
MLIKKAVLDAIRRGDVGVLFRTWKRPTVRTGGTLKTAAGVIAIEQVEIVDPATLTARDAKAAGLASLAELRECTAGREGTLYRIRVRFAGEDPRIALREAAELSHGELAAIAAQLARLDDRAPAGSWTKRILQLIRDHPFIVAAALAEIDGCDRDWLKLNVRKLKNLGLTISHDPGYELSPRGAEVLRHLEAGCPPPPTDESCP